MNLLSSRLVPLVLVAIGQQYTTSKHHATLVLAFTPPPSLFATARGPIAKKEDWFSCTELKAQNNDDDDDDDEEKDGLDSLMGKKLGINIGAQL